MSYDHAKAGDRALVVGQKRWTSDGSTAGLWNGRIVDVLSDPFPCSWSDDGLANQVRDKSGKETFFRTGCLIPLRGDPDAKSEPRQADVPRKVAA